MEVEQQPSSSDSTADSVSAFASLQQQQDGADSLLL
jgi:hypothetical protein